MTFFGAYHGPAWEHAAHGDGHGHDAHGHDDAHGGHGGHGAWHGPHESPKVMTIPLQLLAVGAALAGFLGIPSALMGNNAIEHFLHPSFTARAEAGAAGRGVAESHAVAESAAGLVAAPAEAGTQAGAEHAAPPVQAAAAEGGHETGGEGGEGESKALELGLMLLSVLLAVGGISVARHMYITRPELSDQMAARFPGPHRVLLNKYYVDEFYGATAVRGVIEAAKGSWLIDRTLVDGAVNGSGWSTRFLSWLSGVLDKYVVDGLVNLLGGTLREASHGFRRMQTGLIQNYALLMLVGVFAFVSVYLILR
jgi:NADH-quinone oxidoreductase subunit L